MEEPTPAGASSRRKGLTFKHATRRRSSPPVAFTLAFTLDEGADGAITGGRMAFDQLDVAPLSALAEHLPLPEQWRRDLATLALRGSVTDGKFAWDGSAGRADQVLAAAARSARFGIAASAALPGAAGVSGSFTFDETRGDLKLDSRDMRVTLPRVFADPLVFDYRVRDASDWTRG